MIPKFRAWDKKHKLMIKIISLNWYEHIIDYNVVGLFPNTESVIRFWDETIVMQSTGLKDKNGVEIYEGDILYFEPYETHSNDRVVEYIDGAYRGRLIRNGYSELLAECIYETKVIGNIWENQELLEVSE